MKRIACLLIAWFFLSQLLVFEQVYAASRAVIKSASEYDYPPFCIVSPDGKADGFSVELLREALSAVNLDVEFKTGEWEKIKKELSNGVIQVLPLVGRTPEREAIFDFTFPYLTLHGAIFVRKGETRIKQVSDLFDKTVVVMRGDNAEEFALRTNISSKIVAVDTYEQAMQLLDAGKYDAVIAQRLMGISLLNKIKIKTVVPLDFDLKGLRQDFCFAVRDGNSALLSNLNEGLSIVIANGTFARLQQKWFGPLLQEQITFKDVLKYALPFLIMIIVAILLLSFFLLRAELKRKTKNLVQEIDQRKRVEEALREREVRYHSLFDQANEGLLIMSLDGQISEVNQSFAKIHGYTIDELKCIDIRKLDVLKDRTLEDRGEILRRIQDGEVVRFDVEHYHKDGHIFPLSVTTSMINMHGQNYYLAFHQDITERTLVTKTLRDSERQYKYLSNQLEAILDHIPGLVFYKDNKNIFIRVNKYFAQAQRKDKKELEGKSLTDIYPKEDAEKYYQDDLSVINSGVANLNIEEPWKTDEGVKWVSTSKIPFVNATGEIIGVIGISMDITSRKRAEEEKAVLEERLIRAEKMEALGLLAGGVAHDLNNVLGIVVGYAELLLGAIDEKSPLRKEVQSIMTGGQRAAAIVEDMLTLARRGVAGRTVLNLNKLISDLKKSPQWEKLLTYHPNAKVQTELEPDLLNISASLVHLEKTLYNLIANATEAMPKGGIITIKTTNQYIDKPIHGYDTIREGDYVVLSVSDTGEGISETDLKRIFEPFYTKKIMGRSGTGLGLSVVWGTVKDHQGYIDILSEEGKGTTFTLYFQITREDITAEASTVSIDKYMGKGESILVVDDVQEQRELASRSLKSLNYNVVSATSGEDAVEYLKDHQTDLIVLDMIMDPGMDGLDTYQSIKRINPKQKAIIVSGFSESDRVKEAQELGAGAYVKKPYILEKLGMAVKKELDRE